MRRVKIHKPTDSPEADLTRRVEAIVEARILDAYKAVNERLDTLKSRVSVLEGALSTIRTAGQLAMASTASTRDTLDELCSTIATCEAVDEAREARLVVGVDQGAGDATGFATFTAAMLEQAVQSSMDGSLIQSAFNRGQGPLRQGWFNQPEGPQPAGFTMGGTFFPDNPAQQAERNRRTDREADELADRLDSQDDMLDNVSSIDEPSLHVSSIDDPRDEGFTINDINGDDASDAAQVARVLAGLAAHRRRNG